MKNICYWILLTGAQFAALHIYGPVLFSHFAGAGFQLPPDLDAIRDNAALAVRHVSLAAGQAAKHYIYLYPPPILLLAAPLTWVTPLAAYLAWSAATILALVTAALVLRLAWPGIALALLSPPMVYCLATGQPGGIVGVLLLLSLFLAQSRPALAGLLGGFLVIKPQFALLLPVCYLASGNFRALLFAGMSAAALCTASLGFFGLGLWQYFYAHEAGTAWTVLDMPWPQPFQGIMVSPFMLCRSLGANLHLASGIQFLITLGAAGEAWLIWRPRQGLDRYLQVLLTLCLAVLATPYAFLYDLPALALALVAYVAQRRWRDLLPLTGFWFVTSFYIYISMISYLTGAVFLLLLVAYLLSRSAVFQHILRRETRVNLARNTAG